MNYDFPFEVVEQTQYHTDYWVVVGFAECRVREYHGANLPSPEVIEVRSRYHTDSHLAKVALEMFHLAKEEYEESVCPVCDGRGGIGPYDIGADCPMCVDKGYINPNKYRVITCPDCNGKGGDPAGPCYKCSTSGKTLEEIA